MQVRPVLICPLGTPLTPAAHKSKALPNKRFPDFYSKAGNKMSCQSIAVLLTWDAH